MLTLRSLIAAPVVAVLVGILLHLSLPLNMVDSSWGQETGHKTGHPHPVVIVVGSGLAGSAAALAAAQAVPTAQIIVLEKEPRTGGNSMKASSGINAVTYEHGDSPEAFARDTLASGGGRSDPALVAALVEDSTEALDWLSSMGVDLNGTVQLGGHSCRRTHFPPAGPSVGFAILTALGEALAQTPNVQVVTSARVVGLIREGSRVAGVRYSLEGKGEVAMRAAAAVVLASGGFGASRDFLRRYAPEAADLATTNGAFAVGDGLGLASSAGASLVDLDQVQVHPTGFVDPKEPESRVKFLAPEKLRGVGGILLNAHGRRFVDELATRDVVAASIQSQPRQSTFLLLGAESAAQFGPTLSFYASKGLMKKADSVAAAAAEMGVAEERLAAELKAYNAGARAGRDAFGKTVFPCEVGVPLFVARTVPVVHYTMGGVRIDTEGRVLREAGEAVEGLFAGGEVTGGVHGRNRLGGNSLLECVVLGRRAGKAAAAWATKFSPALST